jgi:hypothetical protein
MSDHIDPEIRFAVPQPDEAPPRQLTEQERLQFCNQAIMQALQQYGCELYATAEVLSTGRLLTLGGKVNLIIKS